jgi:hypothetical protein
MAWPWPKLVAALLAAGSAAGCGRVSTPPAGTGAEAVVRDYFEALVRRDWLRAHAALEPDSRFRCDTAEFAALARNYYRSLGFTPETVRVRSCEEDGREARAHVLLTGRAGGRNRSFRDAVLLRRSAAGWGVALPPRFGESR